MAVAVGMGYGRQRSNTAIYYVPLYCDRPPLRAREDATWSEILAGWVPSSPPPGCPDEEKVLLEKRPGTRWTHRQSTAPAAGFDCVGRYGTYDGVTPENLQ